LCLFGVADCDVVVGNSDSFVKLFLMVVRFLGSEVNGYKQEEETYDYSD
jgi:hypothetical protein